MIGSSDYFNSLKVNAARTKLVDLEVKTGTSVLSLHKRYSSLRVEPVDLEE